MCLDHSDDVRDKLSPHPCPKLTATERPPVTVCLRRIVPLALSYPAATWDKKLLTADIVRVKVMWYAEG
jgi:hypothetical protein